MIKLNFQNMHAKQGHSYAVQAVGCSYGHRHASSAGVSLLVAGLAWVNGWELAAVARVALAAGKDVD